MILAGGLTTVFWVIGLLAIAALVMGLWFPRLAISEATAPEPPAHEPEGRAEP